MEEKVLIKSKSSKAVKMFFMCIIIILLALAVLSLIVNINETKQSWASRAASDCVSYSATRGAYICKYCFKETNARGSDETIAHMLKYHTDVIPSQNFYWDYEESTYCILLSAILCLIYFLLSRCNITITDKNISGRTFWGKKVVLPIHMVSAYSTSNIFSVLSITTSSGFIKFPCIGNYKEIANVLQELLNERQLKTEANNSLATNESNSNSLDDLMKLKNLLDNGIITQEEFDTKKKELLGL